MLLRLTAIGWSLLLAVCLFTNQLDALLKRQHIHFEPGAPVKWASLFTLTDARITDTYWLVVKSGHLLGFAGFELLLLLLSGRRGTAAVLGFTVALGTELLQLYFGRDGRLYDVCIDAAGVAFMTAIYERLRLSRTGQAVKPQQQP